MKRQDLAKHHEQSLSELNASLSELTRQWQTAQIERRFNKLKNVHATKSLRQDIARLKTIIQAKVLSAPAVQVKPPNVKSSRAKKAPKVKET